VVAVLHQTGQIKKKKIEEALLIVLVKL